MKTITKIYITLLALATLAALFGFIEANKYEEGLKLYFSGISLTCFFTAFITITDKRNDKNSLLFVLNLLLCITAVIHTVIVIGVIIIFGEYLTLDEPELLLVAVFCIAYTASLTYLAGKHVSLTRNPPIIEHLEVEEQEAEQDTTF